jgi:hypothetical protein
MRLYINILKFIVAYCEANLAGNYNDFNIQLQPFQYTFINV